MMDRYSPQVGSPNYIQDWSHSQTKHTAAKIDHLADKAAFAIDMLNNALIGFDALEKELMEISTAPHPPQAQSLRTIAHRIDTHQRQVQDGLEKIKSIMSEIDRTTDGLQNRPKGSW